MFGIDDPFWLYRLLVTFVLGGIYLFTVVEGIMWLLSLRRDKEEGEAAAKKSRVLLADEIDLRARVPTLVALSAKVRRIKLEVDTDQGLRIVKKLAILKLMNIVSVPTIKVVWKELVFIALLLILNGVATYFFYFHVQFGEAAT